MTKLVYIAGTAYRDATSKCFLSQGDAFSITTKREEADIFVFTGGEDINPRLYNQRPITGTHFNVERDAKELKEYENVPDGKWKVGICRGAQLLNVLSGGTMWQDVDNHQGFHEVYLNIKGIYPENKTLINSIHHQMMIPGRGATTLAWTDVSRHRQNSLRDIRGTGFTDSEVLLYKDNKSFCFQAHPEFGHPPTTELFFKLLKHSEVF